ncbi:MAG: hypothetical protein K8L99_06680 [Anaerolineae bacterium]|nr:hypothetical protein [Anaerolineae bacterium]
MHTEQTISRQIGYTVREIATPESAFDYWIQGCDETELLKQGEKEGYTYFPVKENGLFKGVMTINSLKSGDRKIMPLTSDWLIAADTPILHLLELFAEDDMRNFFVLSSSKIMGMVSPADLNRIPSRASVYLLVAHYETLLTELIRQEIGETDEALNRYLSEKSIEKARNTRNQERSEDLELPLIRYIYLFDLVEIIKRHDDLWDRLGFIKRDHANVLKFNTIRNAVAHLNNLLINTKDDIKKINDDCDKIIEYSQKISQLLRKKNI